MIEPNLLNVELLHKLLICDSGAGTFIWRRRDPSMFSVGKGSPEGRCARWNGRNSEKPALTTFTSDGYYHGMIFGKMYRAHRVMWAMYTGAWPVKEIDHINHIKNDNRIVNLRSVDCLQNQLNRPMQSNNKSGFVGVSYCKKAGKWRAQIKARGKKVWLGVYEDISDAIAARQAANIKYGFHKNHGKKAVIK